MNFNLYSAGHTDIIDCNFERYYTIPNAINISEGPRDIKYLLF